MKKIILLLIISVLFVSCSKKTPSGYFPLKIGHKWEYNLTNTNGKDSANTKMTYTIVDTVTAGNNKYYKFKSDISTQQGTNSSLEYYKENAEGILIGNPDVKNEKDLVIIPAVMEVGKEWEVTEPAGKRKYKIAAFEDVTIGDKSYNDAIKIEYEETMADKKNTGFFYFGKNTGLIRFVIKNDMGSGTFSTTAANLTNYTE